LTVLESIGRLHPDVGLYSEALLGQEVMQRRALAASQLRSLFALSAETERGRLEKSPLQVAHAAKGPGDQQLQFAAEAIDHSSGIHQEGESEGKPLAAWGRAVVEAGHSPLGSWGEASDVLNFDCMDPDDGPYESTADLMDKMQLVRLHILHMELDDRHFIISLCVYNAWQALHPYWSNWPSLVVAEERDERLVIAWLQGRRFREIERFLTLPDARIGAGGRSMFCC
jgi:hypothetical protein